MSPSSDLKFRTYRACCSPIWDDEKLISLHCYGEPHRPSFIYQPRVGWRTPDWAADWHGNTKRITFD